MCRVTRPKSKKKVKKVLSRELKVRLSRVSQLKRKLKHKPFKLKMGISLMKRQNNKLRNRKLKQIFFLKYQPKKLILNLIKKRLIDRSGRTS